MVYRGWPEQHYDDVQDDFKSSQNELERLRQANSVTSWIYIGVDTQRPEEAKIGLTNNQLGTRASSPQNPYYTLYCAFKVKDGTSPQKLKEIESAIKKMLTANYIQIHHYGSGELSEIFKVSPKEMRDVVNNFLLENFRYSMLSYHCHERDIGVIEGWENKRYIHGGVNLPYQPNDLSNPPIWPECLTPPGCGEPGCKCW